MILSINLPTIIVAIILICAIGFAIYLYSKNNKKGCSCCNNDCMSCCKNKSYKEYRLFKMPKNNNKLLQRFKKYLIKNKLVTNCSFNVFNNIFFNNTNDVIVINKDGKTIGLIFINKQNTNVSNIFYVLKKSKNISYVTILEEVLSFCKRININKVFIECFNNDKTSEQMILLNNGACENDEKKQSDELYLKRFWFDFKG